MREADMKCFTLTGEKKKPVINYVDVSRLDTADLFDDPTRVKTAAFNATIPNLSWEYIVQSIVKKAKKDIFLYVCIDLIPGDSVSSVITEDCVLLAYDTARFTATLSDKSMPLLVAGTTVYSLCYNGQTSVQDNESNVIYGNVAGKIQPVEEQKTSDEPPLGKYGVELSF
jgi:hypothetical protein